MAVIAAQYLQGYSFSGRLHADNMVRRVRKIVREIDSLQASKLRNIHSHETSPFCNVNLGCAFLAKPSDSSCYDIYKHIKCKYGISNEKTARVRVFLCWFVIKEQTRFLQKKYVLISIQICS